MATSYEKLQAYADDLYEKIETARQKVRSLGEGWMPLTSEWIAVLEAQSEVAALCNKARAVQTAASNAKRGGL